MLSVSNVSSRQAENYYGIDDYYTQGQPTGFWYGKGSQELALDGSVAPEQLNALLNGALPNGESIHQGNGQKRAATDLTFSAPKSVSIQALIGNDQRLLAAQARAVKVALDYAESFIGARATVNRVTRFETTNNAVFAVVRHDTSRAGDPNLHHHCLLLNCTKRADGAWRAFENRKIFEQKTVLDAIYVAHLQKECRALGYEVRQTATGFELAQISREQILHFSKRFQAIEEGLEAKGLSRSTATAEERQLVTLQSRSVKERYDREALQKDWQTQGKVMGITAAAATTRGLNNDTPEEQLSTSLSAGLSTSLSANLKAHHTVVKAEVEFVINHLAEREASFNKNQVVVEVLRNGKGMIDVGQIEKALTVKQNTAEIMLSHDGKKIATQKSLAYERRILEIERTGRNQVVAITREIPSHSLDSLEHKAALNLNPEQWQALTSVLATSNRVVAIQGYAGTGKTTTLKALEEVCKAERYTIVGLAPSHSAVKALGESGISAQTLQSWINNRQAREELSEKSIILIDEAGLVSSKQMQVALERAVYKNARVVLVGDIKQYQGVEAGKPFAQLQKAGMETAVMQKMLRQKEVNLAQAAQFAVTSPEEALKKLEIVEIKEPQERYQKIAQDFAKLANRERRAEMQTEGKVEMQEILILCGTNQAREQINHAVRKELGLEGQGQNYQVFVTKDLTAAAKKRLGSYEVGNVIRFERDYQSLGAKKSEYYTVKAITETQLILTGDSKGKQQQQTIEFSPLKFSDKGFSVGRIETCEIAVREWVKLTTTAKEQGYTNGERAWVEAVNADGMGGLVLKTVSGKQIAMDKQQVLPLDYAYASTGHSAQGLGAKRVLMEKESSSITTNQRSFYTDLTRAKEEVRLYTNDAKALPYAITRQVEKTTALEVTVPRQERELER
jgi:conjugative relaxase-like TrwC/TraI family protein